MKLYEKIIDGKQHCKPANKIVIVKDGMQTFNPTEEMLLADGWVEHTPITYEPTEEEILNREKEYKVDEIIKYDSSPEVNIFYIGEQEMWIDKATRVGLKLRFEVEQEDGETHTILWHDGVPFELELNAAIKMLHLIEKYACKCYDNTQRHIANVRAIEDMETLKNYDYRTGYPGKLRF
jgi:hypothetical protein